MNSLHKVEASQSSLVEQVRPQASGVWHSVLQSSCTRQIDSMPQQPSQALGKQRSSPVVLARHAVPAAQSASVLQISRQDAGGAQRPVQAS